MAIAGLIVEKILTEGGDNDGNAHVIPASWVTK
jgi:hypothetical protein